MRGGGGSLVPGGRGNLVPGGRGNLLPCCGGNRLPGRGNLVPGGGGGMQFSEDARILSILCDVLFAILLFGLDPIAGNDLASGKSFLIPGITGLRNPGGGGGIIGILCSPYNGGNLGRTAM